MISAIRKAGSWRRIVGNQDVVLLAPTQSPIRAVDDDVPEPRGIDAYLFRDASERSVP